ncbi:MAG: hypothetical protein LLG14_27295 [Nocardiaceae bacterium]|nr:hypothetical protein [Nocardiaceae bacterium]
MSIDTVNDLPPRVQYVALAAQTTFPYPFPIFQDADLDVYVNGVLKAVNTDYVVSGEGDDLGGNVALVVPLVGGEVVTIIRNIAFERDTDVSQNGPWSSTAYNDELDKVFLILQQLKADFKRSLRIPSIAAVDDDEIELTTANFANMYLAFDADGKPVPAVLSATTLTQAVLGQLLYPRTLAEQNASVTPTNFAIPSHQAIGVVRPTRYGGVSDDATNANTALANSLLVCAQALCPLDLSDGSGYLCTQNLAVPVGIGSAIDVIGSGWSAGGIRFSGAAVTTGLTFSGSGYSYAGEVRNLRIRGASGAVRGVTFTDCNQPSVSRCHFSNFSGAAVAYLGTLLGKFSHCLVTGCGSATEGSVEVDRSGAVASTTFYWDHSYVSGGNTTVGGLIINRTYHVTIVGGAIESTGIPLRIGHRTDTTIGCVTGVVQGVDFENPGNSNVYIDIGLGCSSAALIQGWTIENCNGSPSGTTTVAHAVRAVASRDLHCTNNNWSVPNGTSYHELDGTANRGTVIGAHWQLFGVGGVPWVRVNDVQQMAAGPQAEWARETVLPGLTTEKTISGTTATVSVDDTQGGYHARLLVNNGGATNMATLTNGQEGMEVNLRFANANTTLVHNPGVAHAFRLTAGVNLTPASGTLYKFVRGTTDWVQVA